MLGPQECEPCDKHPRQKTTFRWYWQTPKDGDNLTAITSADLETVRSCAKCREEEDARDQEMLEDEGWL